MIKRSIYKRVFLSKGNFIVDNLFVNNMLISNIFYSFSFTKYSILKNNRKLELKYTFRPSLFNLLMGVNKFVIAVVY